MDLNELKQSESIAIYLYIYRYILRSVYIYIFIYLFIFMIIYIYIFIYLYFSGAFDSGSPAGTAGAPGPRSDGSLAYQSSA